MSFTWLAAASCAAAILHIRKSSRLSLPLSLPPSVTLPGERRVEGIGGESAEELLPRGRRTDGTKKKAREHTTHN